MMRNSVGLGWLGFAAGSGLVALAVWIWIFADCDPLYVAFPPAGLGCNVSVGLLGVGAIGALAGALTALTVHIIHASAE